MRGELKSRLLTCIALVALFAAFMGMVIPFALDAPKCTAASPGLTLGNTLVAGCRATR